MLPESQSPLSLQHLEPSRASRRSSSFLVEAGVMKKMKSKMKDKMKEKEKSDDGGCTPEIVAIKKTRVVPVAVPVRSSAPASYEYSAPDPPSSGEVSKGMTYGGGMTPPVDMTGPSSGYSVGGEENDAGYGQSGSYDQSGGSGYDEDDSHEMMNDHEDEEEEEGDGYADQEDGYGVMAEGVEGYEANGDEDDDGYRRRSANSSRANAPPTLASALEYISAANPDSTRTSARLVPLTDTSIGFLLSKAKPINVSQKEVGLMPRLRRSLTHSSPKWRVRESFFVMQQNW